MTDPTTLTGEQLLAHPAIFGRDGDVEGLFKKLAKMWHPDVSRDPLAGRVFAHVNALYQAAKRGEYPSTLSLKTREGIEHFPYLAVRPFELGELYVGSRHLIWATERKHDDLARRWLETTKRYKFATDKMRDEVSRYLPRARHNTVALGDRTYTIIARPLDHVRVADVIAVKGPFDPKHAAWIISSAYNLSCWLQYSDVKHLDFTPESYFIDPATHIGALLGGWYYTGKNGDARHGGPLAVPTRTGHLARLSRDAAHLSQIKIMGRRLFGCTSIAELRRSADVPSYVKTWLLDPAGANPVQEYRTWTELLERTFGKRKFTVLSLTSKEVYG